MSSSKDSIRDKTISDFGEQWTHFTRNDDYYGSVGLLADIIEPLVPVSSLKDQTIADIGSGTGRIVNMLLDAGAKSVIAVEPSAAFDVMKRNTAERADRIVYLRLRGDQLPENLSLDFVISLGVLHHIEMPDDVVAAAYRALKPGGKIVVWLYGREGNELYLAVFGHVRAVTTRLPHGMLVGMCHFLNMGVVLYSGLGKFLPLPMRDYLKEMYSKLNYEAKILTIYDQLNPKYAKYYTREEARTLLEDAGFQNVYLHHRHSYSWSAVGQKL